MVFGACRPWENPPKLLSLKPNPFIDDDITTFLKKVIFLNFGHALTLRTRYLNNVELQDPRQAPPGNGRAKWPDIVDGFADDLPCSTIITSNGKIPDLMSVSCVGLCAEDDFSY